MKIQDFTVINSFNIGVTTVAFSKNKKLVNELKELGFKNVYINELQRRFTQDELIDFLGKCDFAIVGLDKITPKVLTKLPNLKAISKYGVGLDNIDFQACKKHNVKILHTQGVNKRSVAELALGNMLSLCRNIYVSSNNLKDGIWNKNGGIELSKKTVGVIGVGHIGKDLINLLKPFGCKILVNDIIDQSDYYAKNGLFELSKEEIFEQADIVTIHTPLTDELRHFVNKKSLSKMKPTALLINTARGGLVNENDLKWALENKIIAGAAIDVYESEPPQNSDLIKIPNLITTPHIGGNSQEAVYSMGKSAIGNILNYIKAKYSNGN
jgi:D-3-phosphoglycerate dehydrogenase